MDEMLETAAEAARRAGEVLVKAARNLDMLEVEAKGLNDFVSSADRDSERMITEIIRAIYPRHSILAEESGSVTGDGFEWIIDPLDGTTNFLHGYPAYGVSIALARDSVLEKAVVYNPVAPEMFTASRGSGAFLYGSALSVSGRSLLSDSLLGTGFPFKAQHHLDAYLATFRALFTRSRGVRRNGAACLDLASVASGRLDGFWEIGLAPWDMAAGALLVLEAGGRVSDLSGGDDYLLTGNIVAGTPAVWEQMLEAIRPHLVDGLRR
jgi:myo-inositol-1(or 4)-monophosphatase